MTRSLPLSILSPFLRTATADAQTGRSVSKKCFRLMCSPQRGAYTVTRFFVILFLVSSPCFGQAWSGVVSSSRAINWTGGGLPATYPDGETTPNPWTPPARTTQYGSTINPSGAASTDLSNINTAMANCTNGDYVRLGSGTFLIQGALILSGSQVAPGKSCTLRGVGPMSTTLAVSGSGVLWFGSGSSGGTCSLTSSSNYSVGSTSLTCSGNQPPVGAVAALTQCDTGFSGNPCTGTSADNGGLFVCGYSSSTCSQQSGGSSNSSQNQMFYITAVSGSGPFTVTTNEGLYLPNWAYARTPVLSWNNLEAQGVGVGLEDVSVVYTGTGGTAIQVTNAYASWVKGVRFVGAGSNAALYFSNASHCLVLNSYFFPDPQLDGNYPPAIWRTYSSDLLILNNMMMSESAPIGAEGGNSGNVTAYNFARDSFTAYPFNLSYNHHAFDSFDLWEGNEFGEYTQDNTWGTSGLFTFFRNVGVCSDTPYATFSDADYHSFQLDSFNRFMNTIGNAWGSSFCTSYSGGGGGSIYIIGSSSPGDSLAGTSLMRWGNCDVVSSPHCRFVSSEVPASMTGNAAPFNNPVPPNNNLPCSFYFSVGSSPCSPKYSGGSGLSFWSVCKTWTAFPTSCSATQTQPFPIAGPELTSGNYVNGYAYDVPAAIAWEYLPVDATYQKSFTISGSSWSGGIETLTFTGGVLPNTTHLMGAFQLSGVNSACTNGAFMTGANSELLMTGSNSTTVQYALASNPGTSCTGTMKFPDVRQFDERVYMADGSGVGDP